jgi:hypothetical protein
MQKNFLLALSLLAAAILLRYWLAPLATQLPADYMNETKYSAQVRFRESLNSAWQEYPLLARRVDQTLIVSGNVAMIQGESHWTTEDGTPTYEPIGLYGVERRTRINLPGYGDRDRSGLFLFPPHLEQKGYDFWDPYYLGPRTAVFQRVDQLDGLTVFIFAYIATDIDDTAGYAVLPEIPERYKAISNGRGTLWIEPVSGIVVGFEDSGVTDFVDNETGEHVADFYHWTASYTPETRAAQIQRARASRLRILALETWLPAALLALGIILLTPAVWQVTRAKTAPARQPGNPAPLPVLKDEEQV